MKNRWFLLILVVVALFIGCQSRSNSDAKTSTGDSSAQVDSKQWREIPEAWKLGNASPIEKVKFKTSDGVEIVGNYRPAAGTHETKIPGVVCIPMLGKTKETYDQFTQHLSSIGIATLAIDLRGHGESTMGGTLRYSAFKPEDWQNCLKDVNSSFGWLKGRKEIDERYIGIMGASIGANFALMVGGRKEIGMIIALSPGLDYHGVTPEEAAAKIKDKPVFLVATDGDKYSAESVSKLAQIMSPVAEVKIIEKRKEHGTNMFEIPFMQEELVRWIKDNFDQIVRDNLNIDNAPKKGKPVPLYGK